MTAKLPNSFGSFRGPEGRRVDMNFQAIRDSLVGTDASAASLAARVTDLETVHDAICIVDRASQSISHNTNTNIGFDTEALDPLGWHDNVTNNHIVTPTIAGWYQVDVMGDWLAGFVNTDRLMIWPVHNNDGAGFQFDRPGSQGSPGGGITNYFHFDGVAEHVACVVYQFNGSSAARSIKARMVVRLVRPDPA